MKKSNNSCVKTLETPGRKGRRMMRRLTTSTSRLWLLKLKTLSLDMRLLSSRPNKKEQTLTQVKMNSLNKMIKKILEVLKRKTPTIMCCSSPSEQNLTLH
jgi:hypothetical protein